MKYEIGQIVPATEPPRDIIHGSEIAPVWHCVITGPQKESAARAYFRARGIYAFYPSQNLARTIRGKRYETERPIISGMVYVQFRHAAQWDVLKARRIIRGIYCRGTSPVAIPNDVIRHLQGLTVEAERLAQARAEMLRVREGDKARIISGALAGLCVDVGKITGREVWLNLPIGGRIKADMVSLERVLDDIG
jgi:transcription antitermination factor NusG